jgi:hypothetical protein
MRVPTPPSWKEHWVYEDPSGLPEPFAAAQPAPVVRRPAKVVPIRRPAPARPKAA